MATGDGLYHFYRSWYDDPTHRLRVGRRPRACAAGRRGGGASDRGARARARPSREEYGALLDEESRKAFDELLALSRTVFPYVEEHKFFCDYWFLTRWWNKVREFGALLAQHGFLEDGEDVFQLGRHEVAQALDELVLTWATGGAPLGPAHWPPIVARRKELLERLGEWSPPPAIGATPEAITDPAVIMLWGVTTERVQEWASADEGGGRLRGAAASPGVVEGVARVVIGVEEIARVREGDILVCPDHVARLGADLLERQGRRHGHRRRDVARRHRLPRVRTACGRGHRPRDDGDQDGADDPRGRLDRPRHHPRRMRA